MTQAKGEAGTLPPPHHSTPLSTPLPSAGLHLCWVLFGTVQCCSAGHGPAVRTVVATVYAMALGLWYPPLGYWGIGVVSTWLDRSLYKALDRRVKGIGLADDLNGSMRLLRASMGG